MGKNAGSESEASTNTAEMPPSNNREESHQDDDQSPQSHARELDEESLVVDEVSTMNYLNHWNCATLLLEANAKYARITAFRESY